MDADIGKLDVCQQEKKGVIFQELFFCQVEGESNCLERGEHGEGLKLSWR